MVRQTADRSSQGTPAARGGDSWASRGPPSLIPPPPLGGQTHSAEPRALLPDVGPQELVAKAGRPDPPPRPPPRAPAQTPGLEQPSLCPQPPRTVWATLKFENQGLTAQCPVSILQELVSDTASGRCWTPCVRMCTSRDPPGTLVRVNIRGARVTDVSSGQSHRPVLSRESANPDANVKFPDLKNTVWVPPSEAACSPAPRPRGREGAF